MKTQTKKNLVWSVVRKNILPPLKNKKNKKIRRNEETPNDFQNVVLPLARTRLPHKRSRFQENQERTMRHTLTWNKLCALPEISSLQKHASKGSCQTWRIQSTLSKNKGRENVSRLPRPFNGSKVTDRGRCRRCPTHRFSNSNTGNPSEYGVSRVVSEPFVLFLSRMEVCNVKVERKKARNSFSSGDTW